MGTAKNFSKILHKAARQAFGIVENPNWEMDLAWNSEENLTRRALEWLGAPPDGIASQFELDPNRKRLDDLPTELIFQICQELELDSGGGGEALRAFRLASRRFEAIARSYVFRKLSTAKSHEQFKHQINYLYTMGFSPIDTRIMEYVRHFELSMSSMISENCLEHKTHGGTSFFMPFGVGTSEFHGYVADFLQVLLPRDTRGNLGGKIGELTLNVRHTFAMYEGNMLADVAKCFGEHSFGRDGGLDKLVIIVGSSESWKKFWYRTGQPGVDKSHELLALRSSTRAPPRILFHTKCLHVSVEGSVVGPREHGVDTLRNFSKLLGYNVVLPRLQELIISHRRSLVQFTGIRIAPCVKLPNLKRLTLTGMKIASTDDLTGLVLSWPHLTDISLSVIKLMGPTAASRSWATFFNAIKAYSRFTRVHFQYLYVSPISFTRRDLEGLCPSCVFPSTALMTSSASDGKAFESMIKAVVKRRRSNGLEDDPWMTEVEIEVDRWVSLVLFDWRSRFDSEESARERMNDGGEYVFCGRCRKEILRYSA